MRLLLAEGKLFAKFLLGLAKKEVSTKEGKLKEL